MICWRQRHSDGFGVYSLCLMLLDSLIVVVVSLRNAAKLSSFSHVRQSCLSQWPWPAVSQSCAREGAFLGQHHNASFSCDITFHKFLNKQLSDSDLCKAEMEGV
jgi:hypothetical protein